MFCQNCGVPIPDDAKFCPMCGADQGLTDASPSAQNRCPFCGTELAAFIPKEIIYE